MICGQPVFWLDQHYSNMIFGKTDFLPAVFRYYQWTFTKVQNRLVKLFVFRLFGKNLCTLPYAIWYIQFPWNKKSVRFTQNKNKLIDTENRFVVTRGEGCYRAGQRDQLYGDGWKLDLWSHRGVFRCWIIMLYHPGSIFKNS